MTSTEKVDINTRQRIISATAGALLTSLMVTPFDVIKTRAQSNLSQKQQSTWAAITSIGRRKGLTGLYKGLGPALMMSIPSTVIYYVGYESLRDDFRSSLGWYAPLAAGSLARSVAATVISPLELIRTRIQAGDLEPNQITRGVINMVKSEGTMSLWRGLGSTLWRDVPFSAIYWSSCIAALT
jgi:solute carrier family 25, member 39/40